MRYLKASQYFPNQIKMSCFLFRIIVLFSMTLTACISARTVPADLQPGLATSIHSTLILTATASPSPTVSSAATAVPAPVFYPANALAISEAIGNPQNMPLGSPGGWYDVDLSFVSLYGENLTLPEGVLQVNHRVFRYFTKLVSSPDRRKLAFLGQMLDADKQLYYVLDLETGVLTPNAYSFARSSRSLCN